MSEPHKITAEAVQRLKTAEPHAGRIQLTPESRVSGFIPLQPPEPQLPTWFRRACKEYLRSEEGKAVLREILAEGEPS